MSTGATIAVVVGAVVLVGLLAFALLAARRRRLDARRERSREMRREAETRAVRAQSAQASAQERFARADRAEAEAQEKAAEARRARLSAEQRAAEAQRDLARARNGHDHARSLDPDVGDDAELEAREIDRRRGAGARR
jgi:FtsZ-interacting cell division protein ZipA